MSNFLDLLWASQTVELLLVAYDTTMKLWSDSCEKVKNRKFKKHQT